MKLIYKEEDFSFKCNNCNKDNNYIAYIERDKDSAFIQLTGEHYIDLNNIDVDKDKIIVNEKIKCKYCNNICNIYGEYIYPYITE